MAYAWEFFRVMSGSGPGNFHLGQEFCAWGMAIDAVGNVYVTGSYVSGTGSDYLTVKYDTNGKQLWSARYDGPSHFDIPRVIKLDQAGNVYVTGSSAGTKGFDYLTVKYDPNGNELWTARYDGPDHDTDQGQCVGPNKPLIF